MARHHRVLAPPLRREGRHGPASWQRQGRLPRAARPILQVHRPGLVTKRQLWARCAQDHEGPHPVRDTFANEPLLLADRRRRQPGLGLSRYSEPGLIVQGLALPALWFLRRGHFLPTECRRPQPVNQHDQFAPRLSRTPSRGIQPQPSRVSRLRPPEDTTAPEQHEQQQRQPQRTSTGRTGAQRLPGRPAR